MLQTEKLRRLRYQCPPEERRQSRLTLQGGRLQRRIKERVKKIMAIGPVNVPSITEASAMAAVLNALGLYRDADGYLCQRTQDGDNNG